MPTATDAYLAAQAEAAAKQTPPAAPSFDAEIHYDPGTGPMPGYRVGRCLHRVAVTEWDAGWRVCERCNRTAFPLPVPPNL